MADAHIRSKLLESHGITGLFTTRHGGVSEKPFDSFNFGLGLGDSTANVATNLARLCASISLPIPHQVRQVHGRECHWCSGPGSFHDLEADALLSRDAGTAVAVRTADCLPILLADPETGMVAAVHAGWRGTVANVAAAAVEAMVAAGASTAAILASFGPCIGPCCFHIDPTTAGIIAGCSPHAADHVRISAGQYSADLAAINLGQLLATGMLAERIEMLTECTACHPERFYSHRRDQGATGRHLAVVATPAST